MALSLFWNPTNTPKELVPALRLLAAEYPLVEGPGTPQLSFVCDDSLSGHHTAQVGEEIAIRYGSLVDAMRGLGAALAGLPQEGHPIDEARAFYTFGIMLDCSRNAVMTVEHFKGWLRRLALLGYNMAMLYTEDTYQLPGEPFFGILRGAYTERELREIDDYANALGVEMIGCLQTLGHLEQMLKWGAYHGVKDTDRELLVGEPASYELIEKMIAQFARCFRSRRLHIGMDETWTLGRGQFLDRYGKQSGYDILTQHLTEVGRLCDTHNIRPMIWSDMFFAFASGTMNAYETEGSIPEEVTRTIPAQLDLVYWDYHHDNVAYYTELIARHRLLGREPVVASSVWTWLRLWYARAETEKFTAPCIQACRKTGIRDLFFTMWADDGAYCEFDSALAGLAFAAAQAYEESEEALKRRFAAVCGAEYETVVLGAEVEFPPQPYNNLWSADSAAAATIWDDPLLGIHFLGVAARNPGHWQKAAAHYQELSIRLQQKASEAPFDLAHAAALSDFLGSKISFRLNLEQAYNSRDLAALESLAKEADRLVSLLEAVEASFRRQWLRKNKPQGLEVLQLRLGGQRQRLVETGRLLRELVSGARDAIAELDEGLALPEEVRKSLQTQQWYRTIATGSLM